MSAPRGYEAWPFRSLVSRGHKRSQRNECRQVSAEERAAIEARLRSEGKFGPAPAVNAPRGDNDAKLA